MGDQMFHAAGYRQFQSGNDQRPAIVLYEFDLKQGRINLHYVGNRREIYKTI